VHGGFLWGAQRSVGLVGTGWAADGLEGKFMHSAALCAFVFVPRLPLFQKGSFLKQSTHEQFGQI
ncbi:MAG: hypothetical protein PHX69_04210, partial [Simplicispira sp.]|uniref:hypothetical protein n=1 Tax=Simplicispira sp. TaxID=2015802 RepID=UPI002582A0C7